MQDASDVERKLNDNERFKKRRRQLIHRVNMFTDEDNESDGEDIEDDSVQQLADQGGKAKGRPDQHKSDKAYDSFQQREARMGTYKRDNDGRDRKCCDVGQGCKGMAKGMARHYGKRDLEVRSKQIRSDQHGKPRGDVYAH